MDPVEVGVVEHFFSHISVAGIKLSAPVGKGDRLHIKGHTTDMELTVESMQINNVVVEKANKGDLIGIKVPGKCRQHDKVYKI